MNYKAKNIFIGIKIERLRIFYCRNVNFNETNSQGEQKRKEIKKQLLVASQCQNINKDKENDNSRKVNEQRK